MSGRLPMLNLEGLGGTTLMKELKKMDVSKRNLWNLQCQVILEANHQWKLWIGSSS